MTTRANRRRRLTAITSASIAALLATAARAQEAPAAAPGAPAPAPPAASGDGGGTGVQEVVVVGEKRETTVQKAPLAISAISGAILDKDNIQRVVDLNGHVPSLTVAKNGPFNQVVAIRGVGYDTGDNVSSQPGVSYHVDGVYIASPYALGAEFLDVERVEVLRGPQGTVFGQSSTGGAINVITTKPMLDALSGRAEVSYGTYNLFKGEGAINLPIGDTLAIRASVEKTRHDGFATETGIPGYKLDDEDSLAGKIALLWKPTADISLLLSAERFVASHHGAAMKSIDDPNPDPRQITQDFPNHYALQFFLTSADFEWRLPFATFKSLTAYQHTNNSSVIDNDRLTYATAGFYDDAFWYNPSHAFTQEFNLTSNTGGWLDWQLGAFFMREALDTKFYEFIGTDPYPTLRLPTSQADLPYNFNYSVFSSYVRKSYAGFGQATAHLTDWLRLTAGARYTHERLDSQTNTDFLLYSPLTFLQSKDDEVTGKVELAADLSPANMIYGSWSRGFKPGGVNLNNYPIMAPLTFKPETVSAFEIGSKNRFFDNRVTLNLAGFYYDYKNFQFEEEDPIPYQGGVANVPEAHIWGVEAEGSWQITDKLRLNANVTHLDGKFTKHFNALDPSAAHQAALAAMAAGYGFWDPQTIAARATAVADTYGNKPPKLPAWQGSADLDYTFDLPTGALNSRVEYVYRGAYIYRIFNDGVRDRVPSYGIWNLNFEYRPTGSPVTFSLTATNLFDKAGINSRYSNPFGSFTTDQQYIPPRQVFGSIKYAF